MQNLSSISPSAPWCVPIIHGACCNKNCPPLDVGSLSAGEESPDNKDLHRRHDNNQSRLGQGEPKDSALGRNHSRKVPVLPRLEVLLHTVNLVQLSTQTEQGLVHRVGVGLRTGTLLGSLHLSSTLLVLDRDLKVDSLLRKGRHVVGETERVLTDLVSGEDIVTLTLLFEREELLLVRIPDIHINIERSTRLDLVFGGIEIIVVRYLCGL